MLYREALLPLVGHRVLRATTTLKNTDLEPLEGMQLTSIGSWGKYLFLLFGKKVCFLRIHWGMFGQYRLNEERLGKTPTAELLFEGEELLRLYAVSLRLEPGVPDEGLYPPDADVLNEKWDDAKALQMFRGLPPETMVCDVLMDQTIMAGVGNAIKNEALWSCRVHPETLLQSLSDQELENLIQQTVDQSYLFLEERRTAVEGRYPWTQVFRRRQCPRCGSELEKAPTGVLERVSFWCPVCQQKG